MSVLRLAICRVSGESPSVSPQRFKPQHTGHSSRVVGQGLEAPVERLPLKLASQRPARQLEFPREPHAELSGLAPVGYASLDSNGCLRDINVQGVRLLGRGRRKLLGRPLLPLVAEADRRKWL